MAFLLSTASTYVQDEVLFDNLGLEKFKDISNTDLLELGTVNGHDGSTAKVSVECAPAQFWTFDIFCAENGKTTNVSTGSGSLTVFWPMVEAIMNGMFVINSIEKH